MIKLLKLELRNFLSHIDTILDFGEYEGLVLVEGITQEGHYSSNGAGKSTLLEGIVYALTGDTLRGVSVNDVVNRNAKKNTRVTLTFLKDDEEYTIQRYRKDDKFGDSIMFLKGTEDISKRVNKETQKLIEDTLGISYKILVSTVLLGEGLSSRFTQLSDPEKKSLIESTLNMNYDINKIRESANNTLKRLTNDISTLNGEISVLESYEVSDLEMLEDGVTDSKNCLKIYEETLRHLKEEYEKLYAEVESVHPKLTLINNTISQYESYAKQYTSLMQSNEHYQSERDRVLHDSTPVCAMCNQMLQSLESKNAVLANYQNKIDDNLAAMESIEKELEKLPQLELLKSKAESLQSEYAEKSMRAKDIMSEYQSYQVKSAETRKDIESATSMIANAAENHNQLAQKIEERSKVSREKEKYDYFYKLFSPTGIIVNILSDAIDYINTRLVVYSEVLLEKDYRIKFIKGKISLVDSAGASYQSLSNGEKRRLDISLQFALHDYCVVYCGNRFSLMFIDEILDTLDDTGVENIFDVMRLKLDYCGLDSIYVITHNSSLKSKFDRVITVMKDMEGNSKIN